MFLGRSWQKFTKNLFYMGRYDLSEMLIQQPVEFSTAVTDKSLTVWSCLMDHRKSEGVVVRNSILDFRCFGQSETENWRSVPPLFCPETEFSSDVDCWNSITSKPFSGQSRMSNRWKDVRVAQVFSAQLLNRFPREQICFRFLLTVVHFYRDFCMFLLSTSNPDMKRGILRTQIFWQLTRQSLPMRLAH
jgi:hypothetical protein